MDGKYNVSVSVVCGKASSQLIYENKVFPSFSVLQSISAEKSFYRLLKSIVNGDVHGYVRFTLPFFGEFVLEQ